MHGHLTDSTFSNFRKKSDKALLFTRAMKSLSLVSTLYNKKTGKINSAEILLSVVSSICCPFLLAHSRTLLFSIKPKVKYDQRNSNRAKQIILITKLPTKQFTFSANNKQAVHLRTVVQKTNPREDFHCYEMIKDS